jgi:drebrin-like protein
LPPTTMSLGLTDKEIARCYQEIVSGSGKEWMVLSYDKASNDLKVQASGDSGLEEMAEEFMDSRSVLLSLNSAAMV